MNENSMRNDSIWSLIAKFSIPAIVGMVVNAIYNIVDRMFIGKYVGEEALASLIVVFPVMLFIFATSILIGQGGANLISINFGKGNREEANKLFTNTVIVATVFCFIICTALYVFSEDILTKMGVEEKVLDYALEYLKIILIFSPIQHLSFILSLVVRAEGFPKLSMNALVFSALVNIVLDYLFIGIFDWGVAGGALATGFGQLVGLLILISHFVKQNSKLFFRKKYIKPKVKTIFEICVVGFPSFLSTLGVTVTLFLSNQILIEYGGVRAITALAAINSIFTLIIMPINGIQGGIQPIIGFSHGAKLHHRAKETLFKAIIVATLCATIMFIIIQTLPAVLLSIFIDKNSETMEGAVTGLRLFMIGLPFIPINILAAGYFQATQKPKTAIFLGLLRQFLLFTPIIYILPNFIGLAGVWLAKPMADVVAVIISIILLAIDFKKVYKH